MMQVLVVDDDKDLLEMVALVLTSNNMKVLCLNQGSGLFDSISADKPDIVLMDIYLGDSDGRELCRKLKNTEEYSGIPVILYSAGNIPNATIKQSLADDFITKPFEVTQLLKRINLQVKKNA